MPLAVLALGYAGLIYGFAALEAHGTLRTGRWASRLGAMSYPLYLAHAPLVYEFSRFFPPRMSGIAIAACAVLGTIVIVATSGLLAFTVDLPLQRALRQARFRTDKIQAKVRASFCEQKEAKKLL